MKVYVTGSSGFIGKSLVKSLRKTHTVILLTRSDSACDQSINISSEHGLNQLRDHLESHDVIIHLAGLAHIRNQAQHRVNQDFISANINLTRKLAMVASEAVIKRFIFISSIKAAAEEGNQQKPISHLDTYTGSDAYGMSKREAERALITISRHAAMSYTIIRPPLVYGPGVKANFKDMLSMLSKNLPLPLGGMNANQRSMVGIDNLIHLITVCISHPNANNQIFMVSDDHDVSTTELFQRLKVALGSKSWLISIPPSVLKITLALLGKQHLFQKLGGSLRADITHTQKMLNWQPPVSLEAGLRLVAQQYRNESHG